MYLNKNIKLFLIHICIVFSIFADKKIAITVHEGANQTWKGFGGSFNAWSSSGWYEDVSREVGNAICSTLVKDCQYNLHSVWMNRSHTESYELGTWIARSKSMIDGFKKYNPNLVVDLTVVGNPKISTSDPAKWSERIAGHIRAAKEKYGVTINATGTYSEPLNWGSGPNYKDFPECLKTLRTSLDTTGLTDVKIVAPELVNVHWDNPTVELKPILDDPDALKCLDAFGFHSYRMSMIKSVRDVLWNAGIKEFWMTEGGNEYGTTDNYSQFEASVIGNAINDINLGTSYWCWWLPVRYAYANQASLRIIKYDERGGFKKTLKYYYVRQIAEAFKVGTKVRWCTSDLPGDSRYRYMEATFGGRPPIHACAGQNPDKKWAIALINVTGAPVSKYYDIVAGTWDPAEKENVTVHVEELAHIKELVFDVYRTNQNLRIQKEESVTMKNGNISISLNSSDLVTLRSNKSIGINSSILKKKQPVYFNVISDASNKAVTINFKPSINNITNEPISLNIFNLNGKLIKKLTAVSKNGSYRFYWKYKSQNKSDLPFGMHVLHIRTPKRNYVSKIIL